MGTIAITGAAGFIGSHLTESLLHAGHRVIGFDNFDDFYDPANKRRNLTAALQSSNFQLITGDIRDAAAVNALYSHNPIAVIHLAARAGVRPSIEQPLFYEDVNIRGTLTLLEEARRRPQCKFIFGSSSSVYGNNSKVPFSETDPVDAPISPYAATKRAGELLCSTYHHLYGIPVTCLRFFTVYGPRQRPDLAIHKFARLILDSKPIPVFGDGSMSRDFTYIDDIVHGIVAALEHCDAFKIYNLGESRPISVIQLIQALEATLGRRAMIERRPLQPGDVERTCADISSAKKELGFSPKVDFEVGLVRFAQWLRDTKIKPD